MVLVKGEEVARPLTEWQQRLGTHFSALHTKRAAIGKPVFALEHGLDPVEFEQLARSVRSQILRSAPANEHGWAWVVYAAEVGYGYSGDEYWRTFAQQTPGWNERGSRRWVRGKFQQFQKQFGGARPQGPWAQHFSIIAWPILHAILPRDLQQQLARVLFEIRHSFSPEVFASPTALGELIAARSLYASSRFQNLVQETDLIGLVASALLLDEDRESDIILPATLKRLRTDLEREQAARQWLRDARRMAKERFRFRGVALGMPSGHGPGMRPRDAVQPESAPQLRLEPRLILRPKDIELKNWDVLLEIPDLSALTARFPTLRELLTNSRCVVAGSSGRPLARGRLLQGSQRITLERWPRADEALLSFDGASSEARVLLRTHIALRPGPWLFRVASDRLGYEIRGNSVRAGERYVMLSTSARPDVPGRSRPVSLSVEGVLGALLEMPAAFSSSEERAIAALGLSRTRNVRVAPAGLAAGSWDGEGRAEWLVGECPCISLLADHSVDNLSLSLGASAPLPIGRLEPGRPVFIGLDALPVGEHVLSLGAQRVGHVERCGSLTISIRAPQSFEGASSRRGPFSVQVDPPSPTFEQLWSGRVAVEVIGPAGRNVQCTVRLFESHDGPAVITKMLPLLELPIEQGRWRSHFLKHFCEAADVKRRQERARVCEIEFRAEELGGMTLRCEREFSPLRWVVDVSGEQLSLSLIDDTGLDDGQPVSVEFFPFGRPDAMRSVDAATMTREPVRVEAPGGLYVASRGEHYKSIVVSPPTRSLVARRFSTQVAAPARSIEGVMRAITQIELWGHARVAGDVFVGTCQRDALQRLTRQLAGLIGGTHWAMAEEGFAAGRVSELELKRTISSSQADNGFASAVESAVAQIVESSPRQRARRFGELLERFFGDRTPRPVVPSRTGVTLVRRNASEREDWQAELALRLMSDPADVVAWAAGDWKEAAKHIYERPTIARAARFIVLVVSKRLAENSLVSGDLFPGWNWT